MKFVIFTLFVGLLFLSCNSSQVRLPNNQIAADQEKSGGEQLMTDPSGDAMVVTDDTEEEAEEVVTFIDCGPRMVADQIVYIDGKLDENGNPMSQVITPQVVEEEPFDNEACAWDLDGNERFECADLRRSLARVDTATMLDILTARKIQCSGADTGLSIYNPPPTEELEQRAVRMAVPLRESSLLK